MSLITTDLNKIFNLSLESCAIKLVDFLHCYKKALQVFFCLKEKHIILLMKIKKALKAHIKYFGMTFVTFIKNQLPVPKRLLRYLQ